MRFLNLVRGFGVNLINLLKAGEMRTLEGWFGSFFVVFGLSRVAGMVVRNAVALPVLLWLCVVAFVGGLMVVGVVQNIWPVRVWAVRLGLIAMCGLSYAYLAERTFLVDRLPISLFFICSLSWLYWRILAGESVAKGGRLHVETPGVAKPADGDRDTVRGSSVGRRDMEVPRIPAVSQKGR
jgi:hypothetical protein